jgi:hypothetical protein
MYSSQVEKARLSILLVVFLWYFLFSFGVSDHIFIMLYNILATGWLYW